MAKSEKRATSLRQAAGILGVDVSTLQDAKNRGADAFDTHNRVNVTKLEQWLKDHPPVNGEVTEISLKLRRMHAECERVEHKNAVIAGEYVALSELEETLTELFSAIRTDLLALEDLGPQLEGLLAVEITERIREGVRDALRHLASSKYASKFANP